MVYAWRDSGAVYTPTTDATDRVAAAVARWADPAVTLGGTQTPDEVTRAGLGWLAGERTPFGAAVIATVLPVEARILADAWIEEQGLVFAAQACLELAGLLHVRRSTNPAILRMSADDARFGIWRTKRTVALLARVREAMAAHDDYGAACTALRLAESPRHRVVAAFLAPDEFSPTTTGARDSSMLLLTACVRTRAELDAVFQATGYSFSSLESEPELMATLAAALPPDDMLDLIIGEEDRFLWYDWEQVAGVYLPLLAAMPGDRAFRYLLDNLASRQIAATALASAATFPERAVRLLAADQRTPRHADLLRRTVRAHPELIATLPPELAARFAPRDEPVAEVLPPVLGTPPWTVTRKRTRPPSVDGLDGPDRDRWTAWLKGPRAALLDRARRDPSAAAAALIPIAFGPAGPERRQATAVLHALDRAVVLTVAAGYGPAAAGKIEPLLAVDLLPAKIPALPEWLDLDALEPIRTAHGVLPEDAVRHVLTMLAFSKPGEAYTGLDQVRDAADPASLGAFARSLLQAWLIADAPATDAWTLEAQAVFGDDLAATELAALIRAWPSEGAAARAVRGVDVLARIGTGTALRLLHEIATTVKTRTVRERASLRMTEVAGALGMTADGLADSVTPTFGLAGDLTLDFGGRVFTAGFDEVLRPWVADQRGKRLKSLPKPGAADDPELAAAATRRFAEVKKGVRKIASEVLRRLESALAEQRAWTGTELTALIAHPLLFPVGRRLLWTVDGASFRIAEDRSLADVHDAHVVIDPEAEVRLAHPALGIDPAWAEVFADYEIVQPFPQLGREVYARADLDRLVGAKASTVRLLGLERSGWHRLSGDGGWQHTLIRNLPGGVRAEVDLSPGIPAWQPASEPDQIIEGVRVGALGPVAASEIVRDLTLVIS
ncbi:DUF4132 domain-containing protein [Catenuloplanes japonicus]|uniref:DUF4132 domain-containing protein n=1 Tax=Catenuloplanes japonicus TaxID=33876 RepID=UPI00068E3303|nr:DUF4132 domain-containing protein [Catenuloplanes japonicus]